MSLRLLGILAGAIALGLVPWLYLAATTHIQTINDVPEADVALVFGALVRNGKISPLHEERLLAAKALYDADKVDKIVLSNSSRATGIMADYLIAKGVPEAEIERDGEAVKTSGTCDYERAKGEGRRVTMVSQTFHLPRIAFQCARVDIVGNYLAAERSVGTARAQVPVWTKVRVRGFRYLREAALTWGVILGVYEVL